MIEIILALETNLSTYYDDSSVINKWLPPPGISVSIARRHSEMKTSQLNCLEIYAHTIIKTACFKSIAAVVHCPSIFAIHSLPMILKEKKPSGIF